MPRMSSQARRVLVDELDGKVLSAMSSNIWQMHHSTSFRSGVKTVILSK